MLVHLLWFGAVNALSQDNPELFPYRNQTITTYFNNPAVFQKEDGFTLNSTEAITQDHLGFMWIGGRGGLLRFDGYAFRQFPLCVSGNEIDRVRDLWFDSDRKLLWIATWGYGLLRLNLQTYTCTQVNLGSGRHKRYIYWLYAEDQTLWIGKSQGLTALSFMDASTQHFRYSPEEGLADSISIGRSNNFFTYYPDRSDEFTIWLGSVSGLLRFNTETKAFERYYFSVPGDREIASNSIRTIHQLSDGDILLGTWGGGLVSFRPETGTFASLIYHPNERGWNVINHILPVDENRIWITTQNGMLEWNRQTDRLVNTLPNIPGDEVYYGCSYIDSVGRMFYGRRNTFVVYDPVLQQFTTYDIPTTLSENPTIEAKAVYREPGTNNLSVICYGSKSILKVNEETDQWSKTTIQKDRNGSFFHPIGIHHTNDGYSIIADRSSEYSLFSPSRGVYERHTVWPGKELNITYAMEHSDGTFWFSTIREGLIRKEEAKTTQYITELNSPAYDGHYATLGQLQEDHLGNVWISSITGYSVYDYDRDTFFNVPYMLGDTSELVNIATIVRDSSNNIWFATNRHGLMRVDPKQTESGVVSVFTEFQGKNIRAACVDHRGYIWVLTELGLEKFDPDNKECNLLKSRYGVKTNAKDIGKLSDGRMYLVYPTGFQVFHPDSLFRNNSVPYPYLSTISVFDDPLQTEQPLHRLETVRLSPQQNFFSIGFSGIHFSMADQDTFLYKLEGIDPEWVQTTDRRRVFYTNVPSGRYTFRLKSKNNEGIWNERPAELAIIIATPWWKTPWAMALFTLLIGILLYSLYQFQLSRSLAIAENERLREINEWKSDVYANITHEFRTPITVILGMTEFLKTTFKQQNEEIKATEVIRRNGLRLLKLVNDMLDLAKLDDGKMTLHQQATEVIGFIKYECESYSALARKKDIQFAIQSREDTIEAQVDREKLSTILSNLLSNAIKYTPSSGKVCVDLATVRKDHQRYLQLTVSDTGKGFPQSERETIFQRFYQSASKEHTFSESSGLGLALTKDLVELMGGTIDARSRPGMGSTFRVRLPIPGTPDDSFFAKAPKEAKTQTGEFVTENLETVLVVEDNPDVAAYLKWCLLDKYEVMLATNGKKGYDLALEHIPDIVISDVIMPEMDGFTFCAKLKQEERTNHIPVILLTAKATMQDKVYGIRRGADAYLVKPFDQAELLARLDQLLKVRADLQKKYAAKWRQSDVPPPSEDPFLLRAEEKVRLHLSDPSFSNADLARSLHLSESQTYRKLKALTGMSTAIFIRQIRLQRAKEFLVQEELSIAQIAYRTGFNSPAYFSKAFKDLFGQSPSDYRSAARPE